METVDQQDDTSLSVRLQEGQFVEKILETVDQQQETSPSFREHSYAVSTSQLYSEPLQQRHNACGNTHDSSVTRLSARTSVGKILLKKFYRTKYVSDE